MNLKELLIIAINASIKGGFEILDVYESDFKVSHKDDNSPLTLADMNCNTVIEKDLCLTGIPILSEEGSKIAYDDRKDWNYFWLIDPLDGTKEFVKRNGEFTVNIALIFKGNPIMGIIYVPVKQDLYFAMEDFGSYKKQNVIDLIDSLEELTESSCRLPIKLNKEIYTIVGSRSHMSIETEEFFEKKKQENGSINVISVGSSLKLCMVAEGRADAYPRYAPTMEWDTGAGHAIVKYAGFSVTQYNTNDELIYNKENLLNPWFLAK